MKQIEDPQLLIVVTSFSELDDAQALARQLLENQLAACVQIQDGIYSVYRWEDKLCQEREVILSAKTISSKWSEIHAFIKDHHPYDLPEVIAFTPAQYDQQYGAWVQAGVNS